MGFVNRLFGKRSDPTQDWDAFGPPLPEIYLPTMRFGALAFGDPIENARFLGRPDRIQWTRLEYCELLYASRGFQVDFDNGRLAYLAFFLGPDEVLPHHDALEFAKPRVRGGTTDGLWLSCDADRTLLEELLGPADAVDADPDETILYYPRRGVMMEFEMDGRTGRLKRWNLYPK